MRAGLSFDRFHVQVKPGSIFHRCRQLTYEYNLQNSIYAKSGKRKYKFDIAQENFAWIAENKIEKKMIKTMKKGSRIMVTGYNRSGSQTIDHYSLMGFTKAYNTAKKSCS